MQNSENNQDLTQVRLTDLETKISFQDHSIDELNQLVREQQDQIDELRSRLDKLVEMTSVQPEEGIIDISLEVPPPHY